MKVKVTSRGLFIPPELLEGFDEVEIRREAKRIVILPPLEEDPIFALGQDPIRGQAEDAAEQHDLYLYGSDE